MSYTTILNCIALGVVLTIFGCKKDDSKPNQSTPVSTASIDGTYKGTVNVYMGTTPNPPLFSTLNNHTMIFSNDGNGHVVVTSGNLIITTQFNTSGNGFTLPSTVAASGNGLVITEYGSGTLNGNNLTIELNQVQSGIGNNRGKWTGTLTKQ